MLFSNVFFVIRKIDLAGKLRVKTRLHSGAFATVCERSVWGHGQQLCLGCKQLLVERRKQRVSREGIPLAEPVQLLHVQAAQRAQHRHPLVQLQEPDTHVQIKNSISAHFLKQKCKIGTLCIRFSWLSLCKMCVSPNSTLLCTR